MTTKEFCDLFLSRSGASVDGEDLSGEGVFSGELSFENKGSFGASQLLLILLGKKTAFFSAFESFVINREPLPLLGELYVVKDEEDRPRCAIEVEEVQVLPFDEVAWSMARLEGEDENLEQWRERQEELMKEEASICGFEFKSNSKVVFERFSVVFRP